MARNRRVELRVWFDPPRWRHPWHRPAAALRPCTPQAVGQSTVPFRITIDGEPINTAEIPNEADGQRCADVALERADIQVRYDSLAAAPLMNAWATPGAVVKGEPWNSAPGPTTFRGSKKPSCGSSVPGKKHRNNRLKSCPIGMVWRKPTGRCRPTPQGDQVFYLLRVYDAQGRFDETSLKPLNLLARAMPANEC
jgi:hypothetical protein